MEKKLSLEIRKLGVQPTPHETAGDASYARRIYQSKAKDHVIRYCHEIYTFLDHFLFVNESSTFNSIKLVQSLHVCLCFSSGWCR